MWEIDPDDLVVVDLQGVWEREPVIYGGELVELLGPQSVGGFYGGFDFIHEDVLVVAVAIENSDVQNCNLVDFLYRKTIATEVSNCIIVLYESLQGTMFCL